jgi:hypothetical protein
MNEKCVQWGAKLCSQANDVAIVFLAQSKSPAE